MKKLMKWYLKWTLIGTGAITLTAFLIGSLIRTGWLDNCPVAKWLRFYNDCEMIMIKTWGGNVNEDEAAE